MQEERGRDGGRERGRKGWGEIEREKVRERAQERAWKISCFVGGLKSVFQTFQSLGQKFINQAVLLTSHKSRALVYLTPAIFFFFNQIKVCALRHSKELLPSGLQGHACKERDQTYVAEGYATLSEGRWSILRKNEQRGIQRGSSEMIQENSPIPMCC